MSLYGKTGTVCSIDMENLLTKEQRIRYSRSLMLPGFSEEHQLRLLRSRVLFVGAGALGSVAAMYLAASGTGYISVADFDTVDLSNLQRQLSYTVDDIGLPKAEALARRIRSINPEVSVETLDKMIDSITARTLIPGFDLVMECSDNPSTKYMISQTAMVFGVPAVIGGISETRGQIVSSVRGHAAYTDWFPEPGSGEGFTPCSAGGIFGPVPGIIGSAMAAEALKILTGLGIPLYDRMLTFDAMQMTTRIFEF